METGQLTITDAEGRFHFELNNDYNFEYLTLKVSYIGYQSKTESFRIDNEMDRPHTIYLREAAQTMAPVTVLARRKSYQPGQQMDVMSTVNPSHDAGQFIKDSPNVSGIRKGGSFGVDPVVRGFKKNQLMVQMDGVLQSQGSCPNRMDPPISHVQLEHVSEVEILKGPYALKHGPAFGGVINFKSNEPDLYENEALRGYLTTGYESNIGRQRYSGGIEKYGGSWTTRVFGSYVSAEDYQDGSGKEVRAGLSNMEYTVESTAEWNYNSSLTARFSQGFVRDADYPTLMMDMRKDDTSNLTLSYRNNDVGSGNLELSLFGSMVDHTMDNLNRDMSAMVEAVTEVTTDTYGYDITYTANSKVGSWVIGVDATLRSMEGFRNRSFLMGPMAGNTLTDNVWQGSERNQWGGVVEFQPNLSGVEAVIATRLDYYHSNATDPDPNFEEQIGELSNRQLSWSASAGLSKSLNSSLSAGLWLGRSERYPGMDELFINFLTIGLDPYEYVGNTRLKTEKNHQADLMVNLNTGAISMETSVFYSYVVDYISAGIREDLQPRQQGVPGVKQFVNVDEAALYGFEWTLRNNRRSPFGYELSSAYTIGRNLSAGEDLPQIPAFEANLKLDYLMLEDRLMPQLHLRGVAGQDRVAETFGETTSEGYFLTNFKISYRALNALRFSAGVNNLFDVTYHEHLNRNLQGTEFRLNDPGRSLFIEIKWEGILSKL